MSMKVLYCLQYVLATYFSGKLHVQIVIFSYSKITMNVICIRMYVL